MDTQKIIWTVLPNGYSETTPGNLRFSVFVSPRLSSNQANPTLALFEDFRDWPAALAGIDFGVQFGGNAPVAATRVGPTPDSALYKAMFTPDGSVYSYESPKLDKKAIRSYAWKNVEEWIKGTYQNVIAESPVEMPLSVDLSKELEPIMFYEKPVKESGKATVVEDGMEVRKLAVLSKAPTSMERVVTRRRVSSVFDPPDERSGRTRLQTGNIHPQLGNVLQGAPESVYTTARLDLQHLAQEPTFTFKASTLDALDSIYNELAANKAIDNSGSIEPTKDFLQISLFHRPKQPHISSVAIPSFDFHEACASLSNYPEIMRRIGMIIDLEVPASAVSGNTIRLLPVTAGAPLVIGNLWNGADSTSNVRPLTRFTHDGGNEVFRATPKNDSGIEEGILDLGTSEYSLTSLDVDGAALKMLALANTLRHYATPDLTKKRLIAGTEPVGIASQMSPTEFASKELVVENASLPALRTAGISLIRTNQALGMANRIAYATTLNQKTSPGLDDGLILWADDLVKGYRIDIHDSETEEWRSLCKRKGVYDFERTGQQIEYDDEGWVELGAASAADQEIEELQETWYVPEVLASWTGWSKVAPQPGKKIIQPDDPSQDDTWNKDPNTSQTDYGLATNFRVQPGTLPSLRYGVTYRMRARVVDIAGNGLALEDAPSGTDSASEELTYRRFEPIPAPFLIPKTGIKPGESVEHLVVRSNFNKTAEEYAALFPIPNFPAYPSDRHIVPSRQAQRMAEDYGLFDKPGTMKPDPATYNTIINNDAFFPPFDAKQANQGVRPEANVGVPWLPDMGEGTTFRGLPGTSAGTLTKVPYGSLGSWPEYTPIILRLIEGEGAPSGPVQESGVDVLTVRLPKATMAKALYSSYLDPAELQRLEVWEWLQGKSGITQTKAADGLIWSITPHRGLTLIHVVQQPLEEPTIPSLIPSKSLGDTFAMLKGKVTVHGASTSKLDVYAEWEEPIDNLALPGPKRVQKKNLAFQEQIDFDDEAFEFPPPAEKKTEDAVKKKMRGKNSLSMLGGAKTLTSYKVQETPELGKAMQAGSTQMKAGNVVKSKATASKAMSFGKLGFTSKPDERIRHDFGDTKYRRVSYRGVTASRFREYFLDIIPEEIPKYPSLDDQRTAEQDPTNLLLTRTGDVKTVDILNSARPAAPKVLYVLPTFAFETEKGSDTIVSKRISGLRIWLDRPWYSSGDGEKLGVVLWPSTGPKKGASSSPKGKGGPSAFASKTDGKSIPKSKAGSLTSGGGSDVPEKLLPYVTQWGADPIWMGGRLRSLPTTNDFLATDAVDSGLSMAEFPEQKSDEFVSVAAYDVGYDSDRRLWYCDIEVDPREAYFPFLRMGLARYQPKSVVDAHLSRIVMADFIQVTPDRSVTLTFDPSNPRKARVALTGVTYRASAAGQFASEVEITLETATGPDGDLEWIPAEGENSWGVDRIGGLGSKLWNGLWAGEIELPFDRGSQPARLVIREFEVLLGDGDTPPENFDIDGATVQEMQLAGSLNPDLRRRLVYADVVEI